MRISAKVLADSIYAGGPRLITLELNYHRYIHSEFMTHRVFSRNASSSRAIPISRQIDMVEHNPAMPVEWGQNKPGMQAGEPISRATQTEAENAWVMAMQHAVKQARYLKDLGVHKQVVNRLLEPFSFIRVIVTATEWSNFFELRISPLAQPEIKMLAEHMQLAINASDPQLLINGEYHLPFVKKAERDRYPGNMLMMISAARCARVSYLTHDGKEPDIDKDMNLAHRLQTDKHASVFEHQAFPSENRALWRNLRGWAQHRALLNL